MPQKHLLPRFSFCTLAVEVEDDDDKPFAVMRDVNPQTRQTEKRPVSPSFRIEYCSCFAKLVIFGAVVQKMCKFVVCMHASIGPT